MKLPKDYEIYFIGWDALLALREPPARCVLHLDEDPTNEKGDRLRLRRKRFDLALAAIKSGLAKFSVEIGKPFYVTEDSDEEGFVLGINYKDGYTKDEPFIISISLGVNEKDIVETVIAFEEGIATEDQMYAAGKHIREKSKLTHEELTIEVAVYPREEK